MALYSDRGQASPDRSGPIAGFDRQNVLGLVAAVWAKSEHAIASAIVNAAGEGISLPAM